MRNLIVIALVFLIVPMIFGGVSFSFNEFFDQPVQELTDLAKAAWQYWLGLLLSALDWVKNFVVSNLPELKLSFPVNVEGE